MALVLSPPSASALGICVNRAALRAPAAFLVNDAEALRISSELPVNREQSRSLPISRLHRTNPIFYSLGGDLGEIGEPVLLSLAANPQRIALKVLRGQRSEFTSSQTAAGRAR